MLISFLEDQPVGPRILFNLRRAVGIDNSPAQATPETSTRLVNSSPDISPMGMPVGVPVGVPVNALTMINGNIRTLANRG